LTVSPPVAADAAAAKFVFV